MTVRDKLDDSCSDCGKHYDEADEVVPVCHDHLLLTGEWYCGDCHGGFRFS